MNRTRTRCLIAGLTVLAIFGAGAGVFANWAVAGDSDVWYVRAGNTWQAWSVSLLSTGLLLGVCARGRGLFRSTSDRKQARSVAHVQATLFRRH
jgi:hypothetical protein